MAGILRTDTIQNSNTSTIITQTNSTTITIGTTGQTVALASGASSSGFGRTGTVDWDTTKKTTGFTATSGVGYFCDTTSAGFTVTLPSSPTAGTIIGICDYANTFATNNITVARNGSNIAGTASNSVLSTSGVSVTFIYVDSTQGWIVTDSGNRSDLPQPTFIVATGGTILTCGNYKTHVFTGPGTFCVSNAGNSSGSNSIEYLVVAGGGGSGGGAGGAGGYRQNYPSPTTAGLPVTATSYPITVGGGGAGVAGSPYPRVGNNGSPSVFSTITSAGGGYGGGFETNGGPGGSGGGGTGGGTRPGGTGNTPPVSPPQGNDGGIGYGGADGGGGGAGAAGSPSPSAGSPPYVGGNGGIGSPIATTFFGPTSPSYGTPGPAPGRYFAGGGGGASDNTAGTGGSGGGGGGNNPPGTTGTTNTGGGAGGSARANPIGSTGGSGIVVIRYKFQ